MSATIIDKQPDELVIKQLASLNPLEYDRVRKEQAKILGVRPQTLDLRVKSERGDDAKSRLPFSEVEPHSSPIDPAQLLSEVAELIKRCIVLDDEQANATALWIAHTWFLDEMEYSPLAIVNAPESRCGKTQFLTVMERMVCKPLSAANASSSALFRAVDVWQPTILIDEADTFFKDNAELHGMINAGHSRGVSILRSESVKDSFEPRLFSVFSPKALAGIALEKHLPDATMSRGIVFNMRRKLPHESVERLRDIGRNPFIVITEKLARFAQDYSSQVKQTRPILPNELSDRNQDNWEGLLAIASCAGDEWLALATKAALKLSVSGEKTVSTGNELLADIQDIFSRGFVDELKTVDLIDELCKDDEAPWVTYNKVLPINPRQLTKLLKPYGIASKTIRLNDYETAKGYQLKQFEDSFERYLNVHDDALSNLKSQSNKSLETNDSGDSNVTLMKSQISNTVTPEKLQGGISNNEVTPEAPSSLDCYSVTDKSSIFRDTSEDNKNTSHLRI